MVTHSSPVALSNPNGSNDIADESVFSEGGLNSSGSCGSNTVTPRPPTDRSRLSSDPIASHFTGNYDTSGQPPFHSSASRHHDSPFPPTDTPNHNSTGKPSPQQLPGNTLFSPHPYPTPSSARVPSPTTNRASSQMSDPLGHGIAAPRMPSMQTQQSFPGNADNSYDPAFLSSQQAVYE